MCYLGAMKTFGALLVSASLVALFVACSGTTAATDDTSTKKKSKSTDDSGTDDTSGTSTDDTGCSKTTCGKECVDVKTSAKHCGKCNNRCATGVCSAGKCKTGLVFAITHAYLGDQDVNGTAGSTAWKNFGRNIDGKASTSASTDHCTLVDGAEATVRDDGTNGIDNSFGHNILPTILTIAGNSYSSTVNDKLTSADFSILLRLDGLTAGEDASGVTAAYFGGGAFAKPKYDGSDVWPVTGESINDGKLSSPKASFPNGTYTGGKFDSGTADGEATLYLPVSDKGGLAIPIRQLRVTMDISDDGKEATNGILSGVIPTAEFLTIFKRDRGFIYPALCQGTLVNGIASELEQASDIMIDGTSKSGSTCDGISIGIGFTAAAANLGEALAVKPAVDSCE